MHGEWGAASGFRLIAAFAGIILFVLPGVVFAEPMIDTSPGPQLTTNISPGVTIQSVIPGPTFSKVLANTTLVATPPPILILDMPEIQNLTCTMNGSVAPGSAEVTITSTLWDWGDNSTPEHHSFPNLHVYSIPGDYRLSIAALQSDGQNTTKTAIISIEQPGIPGIQYATLNTPAQVVSGAPGMMVNAPVLTLLEPVIDGTNVTLNGNLNPGSPGATIESVNVDWNDGNTAKYTDLPVTHLYSSTGIFTITIIANQSDGQSTTKRITLDLKDEIPGLPGPVASGPPPNETPVFLIILATTIVVVAAVALVQWIAHRNRGALREPDIAKQRAGPISENLPSTEELGTICSGTDVTPEVLDPVIRIAMEIAREGREGQAIGTSFVVGDTENVLMQSKQFVLNPFQGHNEEKRRISDAGISGNIKEFAQLDGAFLITGTGIVEAAGRCITVDQSKVNLPGGLGSRHSSVAGITQVTKSIGVVVSQSGGLISIFRDGKIVYTISS